MAHHTAKHKITSLHVVLWCYHYITTPRSLVTLQCTISPHLCLLIKPLTLLNRQTTLVSLQCHHYITTSLSICLCCNCVTITIVATSYPVTTPLPPLQLQHHYTFKPRSPPTQHHYITTTINHTTPPYHTSQPPHHTTPLHYNTRSRVWHGRLLFLRHACLECSVLHVLVLQQLWPEPLDLNV